MPICREDRPRCGLRSFMPTCGEDRARCGLRHFAPTCRKDRPRCGWASVLRGGVGVLCHLGALMVLVPTAHAEPQRSVAPAETKQVVVLLVGVAGDTRLRRSIESLLTSAGVAVRFETRSEVSLDEPSSEMVRIWLTRPTPTRVRLLLADPRGEHFLVRDVPIERDLDEVDCERVGQVIESAKDALGRPGTRTREEALAALEVDPQGDSSERRSEREGRARELERGTHTTTSTGSAESPRPAGNAGPRVWLGYSVVHAGSDLAVAHGPGAGAAVQFSRPSTALWLGVEATRLFEQRFVSPDVELRLQDTSLRVVAGAGRRVHGPLTAGAQVGVGLELMRIVPERGAAGTADVKPQTTHATPWAGAGLPFALFWGEAGIFAEPRLDVALAKTHYDLDRGDDRAAVLTPPLLRASANVGIVWSPAQKKWPSRASTSPRRGTGRVR